MVKCIYLDTCIFTWHSWLTSIFRAASPQSLGLSLCTCKQWSWKMLDALPLIRAEVWLGRENAWGETLSAGLPASDQHQALWPPKRKPFEAQLLICSTSDLGRSSSTFQRSAIQSWIALTKLICTELWTMWSEDSCLIRYESPPGLEHPHNKLVQHLFSELARISFKSGMNCILSANMVMLYESFGILCNILFYILEPKSSCIFWFARQQVNAAFLSIRQSYIQACMLMPFLACSCCC